MMLTAIENLISAEHLASYDPYDIWATNLGARAKRLYHSRAIAGFPLCATLTVWDRYLNNSSRLGYHRREYPSVRAMAAQAALLLHHARRQEKYLELARRHLTWLTKHTATTSVGLAWGHGFPWVVSGELTYPAEAGLATVTPYVLEAAAMYERVSGDTSFRTIVDGALSFYERGLVALIDTDDQLATSYSDRADRVVTNAVSFVMAGYAHTLQFMSRPQAAKARETIRKMRAFIESVQNPDGSWYYSPVGSSFIDCFHTCFVVANLRKTEWACGEISDATLRGYEYIKRELYCPRTGLMRRFAKAPRPWIAQYDLYDCAETIFTATLLGDHLFAQHVLQATKERFLRNRTIYSEIDRFGGVRNPSMLRWAVMPFAVAYLTAMFPHSVELYGRRENLT